MNDTFFETVEILKKATAGNDIRNAIIVCLEYLEKHINVEPPKNCPNCGAAVTGKHANCDYCGTILIWKKV